MANNTAWEKRRAKYGPSGQRPRGATPLRRQVEELLADVERLRRRCDELERERAHLLSLSIAALRATSGSDPEIKGTT